MKTLYCVTCGKYRKFEKPKISFLLERTLVSARMNIKKYLKKKNRLKF